MVPLLALTAACAWAAITWPGPGWVRWVLAGIALALVACLVLAVLIGPAARYLAGERAPLSDVERTQMTVAERVEAVNSARHTLVQAAIGLVVIGGAAFTAQGLWYTAETLSTAQQGQLTDRYTKAVEQLGSAKSDVRLGGIYALQRLADDSPRDRDTIRNVLSAFVRNHDGCTLQPGERTPPRRCGDNPMRAPLMRPPADVIAALTTAPTLTAYNDDGIITGRADFTYSRFPRADLNRAQLAAAHLNGANLNGANLTDADLTNANLVGAHLTRANLVIAQLSYANLTATDLTNADLTDANLIAANLFETNLTAANLNGAALINANLNGAHLPGANLYDANLVGADLTAVNLTGADLSGADLRGIRGMTEQEVRAVATVDSNTKFGPLPK